MILTTANGFSLLRCLLAFLFLSSDVFYRISAIILAGITDGLDGYLARRFRTTSYFSANLDAFADKFFVGFLLGIFFFEGRLQPWEIAAFLARDIGYFLLTIYLISLKKLPHFPLKTVWYSKLFTTLQLLILLFLSAGIPLPSYLYITLLPMSLLTVYESYSCSKAV